MSAARGRNILVLKFAVLTFLGMLWGVWTPEGMEWLWSNTRLLASFLIPHVLNKERVHLGGISWP
jgi:hypothetical protein